MSPAKTCVPTDHAIALVPIDAEAYLHIDLDPGSSQFSTARDLASRLPHSGEIEQGIFSALGLGPRLDLRSDIAPWIGDEAAFAELGGGTPQPLVLLAVKDRKAAQSFLTKLGPGKPRLVKKRERPLPCLPQWLGVRRSSRHPGARPCAGRARGDRHRAGQQQGAVGL